MTDRYEPEIGQAIFGQPYKEFEVPEIVEAALNSIDCELERVSWNRHQNGGAPEFDDVRPYEENRINYCSPFGNTGARFKNETFEVEAYSWSDEEQPFNFKWKDVEVSWYKYLGRGMSANKEITPDLASNMLIDCLNSLRAMDTEIP